MMSMIELVMTAISFGSSGERSDVDGRVTLRLPPFENGRILVRGIPFGRYEIVLSADRAGFGTTGRPWSWSRDVEIGATTTMVEVDMADSSILMLTVLDRSGTEYSGPLAIEAARPGAPGRRAWEFDSPPYRLLLAKPGEYEIFLGAPFRAGNALEPTARVDARGGSCTEVVCQDR
jgi:hypothetical protein